MKKSESNVKTVEETRYKGSQLLKTVKYDNRIARLVLDAEKYYTFAEADAAIKNYGKRG